MAPIKQKVQRDEVIVNATERVRLELTLSIGAVVGSIYNADKPGTGSDSVR